MGGVILALLVGGGLTTRPLLLIAATTLLTGVIVLQWRATTQFAAVNDDLSVDVAVSEQRTVPSGTVPITTTVTLSQPTPVSTRVTLSYGPAVTHTGETLTIDPGETQTYAVHDVTFPVAGRFEVPELTCAVEDASGVFTETFDIDSSVPVTVEPAEPTNIHVGQGGVRMVGQYGEHQADTTGSGLEIAELREYRASDSVSKIDWKATARLDEAYVREFHAETARRLTLLIDGRNSLWEGEQGRSKFAYLREVALGFIEVAEAAGDPLSLAVVGERGVRIQQTDAETTTQYQHLRWTLQELTGDNNSLLETRGTAIRGPAEAEEIAQQLSARDSPFATTLRPYFANPGSYIERLAEDPLFASVRQLAEDQQQGGWTVLFTDDTDPRRTIEAAKMAAKNDGAVTVFVTPSSLFSPPNAQDRQSVYGAYVEFEEFRQELDSLPGVIAYEVAPGDRLEAILASGQQTSAQAKRGI